MSEENTNQNSAAAGNESNPPREESVAQQKAAQKEAQKQMVEQAVIDSKKTAAQEMAEIVRYPALKLIIRFAKILAITFGVIFAIIAIVSLFTGDSIWEGIVNFVVLLCLGVVFFALTWAVGDVSQLMIDIEENTRKNSK